MKTRSKQSRRKIQLRTQSYGSYYIERVEKLEKLLSKKPQSLLIELVGAGEIPADSALLIRSVLLTRSPKTRIITRARSSLHGGSVLVWLLGDCRMIRNDARVFFRRADLPEDAEAGLDDKGVEPRYRDSYSEIDPDEGDYARVLQLINEFLPVKELTGRLIGTPVLRQFGLVENEQVDEFLTTAFGKSERALAAR